MIAESTTNMLPAIAVPGNPRYLPKNPLS